MAFKLVRDVLNEEILTEDNVVKFNGETYPSYGWCVILCGGSGTGKSTASNLLVPIDARKYDVDILKSEKFYTIAWDGYSDILTFNDGTSYDMGEERISEPYTLSNPDFVRWLHQKRKPLADKLKKAIFKAGSYASKDRLPNIMFDITGKNKNDFESIVSEVKPIGYKVAIVWVLGDVAQAIENNAKRERKVPIEVLLKVHRGVFRTIEDIGFDTALLKEIDEFWVILQTTFDTSNKDDMLRYKKLDNVFHIDNSRDALVFPETVASVYNKQKEYLSKNIAEESYDNLFMAVNKYLKSIKGK